MVTTAPDGKPPAIGAYFSSEKREWSEPVSVGLARRVQRRITTRKPGAVAQTVCDEDHMSLPDHVSCEPLSGVCAKMHVHSTERRNASQNRTMGAFPNMKDLATPHVPIVERHTN